MRATSKGILSLIFALFISAVLLICATSCQKEAPIKTETVTGFYDNYVILKLTDIQKAVTDPNIDGWQFQCKVDSLEDYINENPVSIDIQRLEQSTLNKIEHDYDFIIDHWEGGIL